MLYTLFFFIYIFLRREPKSLRSDYNKGRPAAVIMSGVRSLFSTLYNTDSFLASRQTESFSLALFFYLFSVSLSLTIFRSTSIFYFLLRPRPQPVSSHPRPPIESFSPGSLNYFPRSPPFILRPSSGHLTRHPAQNNFSYIIRTRHTLLLRRRPPFFFATL